METAAEFRAQRVEQRLGELRRAVEVLISEMQRWERPDVPADITPVPFMVAYGLLSQLAADLATAHDPIAHQIVDLSERVTAAVRRLHDVQNG